MLPPLAVVGEEQRTDARREVGNRLREPGARNLTGVRNPPTVIAAVGLHTARQTSRSIATVATSDPYPGQAVPVAAPVEVHRSSGPM